MHCVDTIVTAIGMVDGVSIMVVSVSISMALTSSASGPAAAFVSRHPTTKTSALAFLILIGASPAAEATGHHMPRGSIHSARAFAAAGRGAPQPAAERARASATARVASASNATTLSSTPLSRSMRRTEDEPPAMTTRTP